MKIEIVRFGASDKFEVVLAGKYKILGLHTGQAAEDVANELRRLVNRSGRKTTNNPSPAGVAGLTKQTTGVFVGM